MQGSSSEQDRVHSWRGRQKTGHRERTGLAAKGTGKNRDLMKAHSSLCIKSITVSTFAQVGTVLSGILLHYI